MRYMAYDGGQSESLCPQEKNTCTVRALAISANIPYEEAREIMQSAGRKFNDRVSMGAGLMKFGECGGHYECIYSKKLFDPRIPLRKMLQNLGEGHYIVRIKRHVFAVVNGLVYDMESLPMGSGSTIKTVWKITPIRRTE